MQLEEMWDTAPIQRSGRVEPKTRWRGGEGTSDGLDSPQITGGGTGASASVRRSEAQRRANRSSVGAGSSEELTGQVVNVAGEKAIRRQRAAPVRVEFITSR